MRTLKYSKKSNNELNVRYFVQKKIGWRSQSRKLVVMSTDASFHYAGDGKVSTLYQGAKHSHYAIMTSTSLSGWGEGGVFTCVG